jgi:hypothetical protein
MEQNKLKLYFKILSALFLVRIKTENKLYHNCELKPVLWVHSHIQFLMNVRPFTMHCILARYPRQWFILRDNYHNALSLKCCIYIN